MTTVQTTPLQRVEAALAESWRGYPGKWATFGPLSAVYAGPGLPVNVALGATDQENAAEVLAQIEDFYALHSQAAALLVHSHAHPALFTALAARNYHLDYLLHTYARTLSSASPASAFDVGEMTPDEWAEITPQAFGAESREMMRLAANVPDVLRLGVRRDKQWAGFGAVTVMPDAQGGVALLFSAGTLPEFRGQGIQSVLLAARLHVAREQGATLAAVDVAPNSVSERNVKRAGFEMVGARLNFVQAQS
ncbi:GNAT family N-acetyltransferase [Deinococcus detaillensis]|uniref:GNAT family N-acetyltransferase n=1 Tax=Deinococcus detaillensis TaxID=2592048 RepID=A0A553V5L0_9DEIO|nr:GNAT family N-acetyltransferase [Deinococcus detaillensis]TSA87759.1 GNAT family N-acetyltransferase [Deinococcus detaillensis]